MGCREQSTPFIRYIKPNPLFFLGPSPPFGVPRRGVAQPLVPSLLPSLGNGKFL